MVALVDDARDGREVRAPKPHGVRLGVHLGDEAILRAGDVLRERDRGVVARRQQQPVEQGSLRHALAPGKQAYAGAGEVRRLPRDQDPVARLGVGDDDERGHHLGQAGDRQHTLRRSLPQHRSRVDVEQQAASQVLGVEANLLASGSELDPVLGVGRGTVAVHEAATGFVAA